MSTVSPNIGSEEFHCVLDALLDGLHATAQPLTVLRCRLDEESLCGMDADALRRAALESIPSLERIESLVDAMHRLVAVACTEVHVVCGDPVEALRRAVDGVALFFAETGVTLRLAGDTSLRNRRIDAAQLEQAILLALLIVHAVSRGMDQVMVCGAWRGEAFRVTISSPSGRHLAFTAEQRLRLALINILMCKQGGSFHYGASALPLTFTLPGDDS